MKFCKWDKVVISFDLFGKEKDKNMCTFLIYLSNDSIKVLQSFKN